eukprot:COSAG01_NODE_70967_length_257_cov_0.658228_1_plen_58_part_10
MGLKKKIAAGDSGFVFDLHDDEDDDEGEDHGHGTDSESADGSVLDYEHDGDNLQVPEG